MTWHRSSPLRQTDDYGMLNLSRFNVYASLPCHLRPGRNRVTYSISDLAKEFALTTRTHPLLRGRGAALAAPRGQAAGSMASASECASS